MARHHYVPQFLLREWATSGQIVAYRWLETARKVTEGNTSVVEACQVEDLNTFFGLPSGHREAPERDFWTPYIDTPAADAHRTILDKGLRSLSPRQCYAWAQFIVAFGVRTPETLRILGPKEY
jgi:hypothetical protein